MSSKSVFVTVGTTDFDELIMSVTERQTLEALKKKGYKSITLQIGNGKYVPETSDLMQINYYKFKPDIEPDMSKNDLIISHGGAGSIMQALDHKKHLLVVINEKLMDNHQFELAEKLSKQNCLYFTTTQNLCKIITNLDLKELKSTSIDKSFYICKHIEQSSKEKETSSFEKDVDIMDSVEDELGTLAKKDNSDWNKFTPSATGVGNCVFIGTTIDDPCTLMYKILEDIEKTKVQKTKFLLRMLPITITCKANVSSIISACTELFPKYFTTEPTTFAIVFNHRYNNSVPRSAVIEELANKVAEFGQHKVDLSGGAKLSIIVEVVKAICCLSVVKDYGRFFKFNLLSVCGQPEKRSINDEIGCTDNNPPKIKKNDEEIYAGNLGEKPENLNEELIIT